MVKATFAISISTQNFDVMT